MSLSFLCLILFCTWTWMRVHVHSSIFIPIHHCGLLLLVSWRRVTVPCRGLWRGQVRVLITAERAGRIRAILFSTLLQMKNMRRELHTQHLITQYTQYYAWTSSYCLRIFVDCQYVKQFLAVASFPQYRAPALARNQPPRELSVYIKPP